MKFLIVLFVLLTSYCYAQNECNAELKDEDLRNQAELDSLAAQLNGVQFRLEAEVSYFKVRHVIFLNSGENDVI